MKTKLINLKNNPELLLAILCGICMFFGWILHLNHLTTLSVTLYVLAYITGGYSKTIEGMTDLIKEKDLNVDLLMMIAALGAASIGYWEDGAMLIFIFSLSGALETYTFNKSHKEISALLDLQPEKALRLNADGIEELVQAENLQINDIILVKPGERIPSDGTIISGETNIDESSITGESMPIEKSETHDVFASTVNLRGSIRVKITKLATDTLFSKIIKLVQEAKSEKSNTQLFIEKWEGLYVKLTLLFVFLSVPISIYLFGLEFSRAMHRAMVLLIVASPCAVVASITPATLSAISNGARNGILFKGGVQLEKLASLEAIAFDKTGTLTKGRPDVTDVLIADGISTHDFLQITATLESHSTHPLANSIINYAKTVHDVDILDIHTTENVVGFGIEGVVNDVNYRIGKSEFFKQQQIESFHFKQASGLLAEGKTLVYVANLLTDQLIGLIALKDTVRTESKSAVEALNAIGVATVMITGDNSQTAQIISNETSISEYYASCLPQHKVDVIKELKEKYQTVAMTGDGINDAPALATADIGIAMGEGTDVALETADLVLMKNNLQKLSLAVILSKRLSKVTRQNLVFSMLVISTLIIFNFVATVPIPLAVLAHEGSTILVILNGLRLLKN